MDPVQFLRLAEWLLAEQRHAAGLRSAVSRAYYAAHHHVKDFVESAGVRIVGSGAAHADVWNHLTNVGDPDIERVGIDLTRLHAARIDADYRLSVRQIEIQTTAGTWVAKARDLFTVVEACRADEARWKRVADAIRRRHAILRY